MKSRQLPATLANRSILYANARAQKPERWSGGNKRFDIRYINRFGRFRHVMVCLHVHPVFRRGIECTGKAHSRVRRHPGHSLHKTFDPSAWNAKATGKCDCPHLQGIKVEFFQDFAGVHRFLQKAHNGSSQW